MTPITEAIKTRYMSANTKQINKKNIYIKRN